MSMLDIYRRTLAELDPRVAPMLEVLTDEDLVAHAAMTAEFLHKRVSPEMTISSLRGHLRAKLARRGGLPS